MKRAATFILGLLFAATSFGQQALLVFGNGIGVTEDKAWDSQRLLENSYAAHLGISLEELRQTFVPQVAYNTTACDGTVLCLVDWYEALVQAGEANDVEFDRRDAWRLLVGREPSDPGLGDLLGETLIRIAARFDQTRITAEDLARHLESYQQHVGERRKVVVVAHSQGNFFANESFDLLAPTERGGVGVVSVATPASFVAREGPYTTVYGDFISSLPGALASNTDAVPACGDQWNCHHWSTYMKGDVSGPQIMNDIDAVLASLVITPPLPPPVVPDMLVAIDASRDLLVRIDDPDEAVLTTIGPLGVPGLRSLAFDRHRRVLYAIAGSPGTLYTIDTTTGRATLRVPLALESSLGFQVRSIAMGPDGLLYGLTNTAFSNSRLVVINVTTGAVIGLTSDLGVQFDGITYDPESSKFFLVSRFGFGRLYSYTPETGLSFIRGVLLNGLTWLSDIPGSTDLRTVRDSSFSIASILGTMTATGSHTFERRVSPLVRLSGVEMVKMPE